jgi:acyl-CoA thioesterase
MDYEKVRVERNKATKFANHLGIEMVELREGYARGEVVVQDYFENMVHSLHGGIIYTLADAAGGAATACHGKAMTTINSDFHYLNAGINVKKLIAIGKMVKEGKRIGVVEVEVYNDTEKLLAKGTFTYYFLEQDIC